VAELYSDSLSSADPLKRLGVALADPTRQAVLMALARAPRYPSDLAKSCGTTRSNLSNHLTCLRGCGLVVSEREGRRIRYELVSSELGTLLQALDSALRKSDSSLERTA